MTSVAVITVVHGRHEHLTAQHRSLSASTRCPDDRVVVAMGDPRLHDWAPTGAPAPRVLPIDVGPQGLPLAAARNLGAQTAIDRGADVLVFLDVDCLAAPTLVADYAEAVTAEPQRLWCGPVTYLPPAPAGGYPLADLESWDDPHPARPAPAAGERIRGGDPDLFWSLSFALHRDTWARIGGFCEQYVGYGGEDTDFAQCAVAAGLELGWTGAARAFHQHHPVERPPIRHLDDILRNGAIFRRRWGRWPMQGWLDAFAERGLVERHGDDWVRTTGV
ncbi:glycosyltransferase family 2 protein [Aeromicrobium senzhongii]|uniref:Glycosyltransferase family 2 protein n=1 Tax=Aeromicrobium senzhongii TaxID=2663859 RepID=A0ABX6SRH4_9ACTN|nr:galactosyltransferase-related protein [Aeromicrobium senzhongii]MTB89090.1 glycosyltransferase family 2 protein [Aeromicrobium senzhongii]QNL93641.1 glycosyltransferase family 2 protein [Aeromicrobium senzhongii]